MVVGLLALYYFGDLFATHPVTIAVQIAAVLLMIWARLTFGMRSFHAAANPTAGGVVSTGPYAFLRHPIYAAAIYIVWVAAIDHRDWRGVAAAALVTIGGIGRMLIEEHLLVARYPEYRAYMGRTRRVVPFVF